MNLQGCKAICDRFCSNDSEQQQERFANQCMKINKNAFKKDRVSLNIAKEKNVYSFKFDKSRTYEQSDKKIRKTFGGQTQHELQRKEISRIDFERYRSPPLINRFHNSLVEDSKHPPKPSHIDMKEHQQRKSIVSPRSSHKETKVVFHFNTPTTLNGRVQSKRLKTAQEQTQYSSKHSQVYSKANFYFTQNSSIQKNVNSNKHVGFKQPYESSQNISEVESLRTISQCLQEQSYSPLQIQNFNNNNITFQSIMTSTQIKSRHSSKFSGQLNFLKAINRQNLKPSAHVNLQATQQRKLITNESPKRCVSPRREVDPTMFYQCDKQKFSPRVSVLSLSKHNQHQNDEQEQLRDVIDHNFLISQTCSRNNSPKVSINPSQKYMSQNNESSQKKKQINPIHSRDNSWQFGPLMSTHAKMKRTNTIQSLQSFSSEMISCLDIKFMQKNKGRRGVSRLI